MQYFTFPTIQDQLNKPVPADPTKYTFSAVPKSSNELPNESLSYPTYLSAKSFTKTLPENPTKFSAPRPEPDKKENPNGYPTLSTAGNFTSKLPENPTKFSAPRPSPSQVENPSISLSYPTYDTLKAFSPIAKEQQVKMAMYQAQEKKT